MNNNYSYSRIGTYVQCPRKHYYHYIENIETPDSPNAIPGSLFHKCCELWLNKEAGYEDAIKECFYEFDTLANKGIIKKDAGLLRYIFEKYIDYYKKEFDQEDTLLVEYKFTERLNDEEPYDNFTGIVDEVFQYKDLTIVRDRKTALTKLKYDSTNVKYNQQLLLYAPFVEDKLGLKVDAIEIDEVLFARLESVPLLKNGRPTRTQDALRLVTYEDYYEELVKQGIEKDMDFRNVLMFLKKRGHPLFRRTRIQLLDDSVVNSNAQDILDAYKVIKTNPNNKYRNRSMLCDWCEFKELCNLDMYNPDSDIREQTVEKIKNIL